MAGLNIVIRQLMKEKRDVVLSIFFGFIAGIAAVGLFTASGYLISQAALGVPITALTVVIAIVKLLGFTRALSRYSERYFSHRATFTMLSHIRVQFFEKLQNLTPSKVQRFRTGDLLSRFVSDVESLQNFFLRIFYPPIVIVLIFLSTVLFTLYFSFWIALLLVVGLLLSTVVLPALFAKVRQSTEQPVQEKRSDLSAQATELLFGYQDLKIHQKLDDQSEAFNTANDELIQAQTKERKHELWNQVLDGWVGLLMAWAVLAVGGWLIASGQMDGVWLAMFMLLTLTVFENTQPMAAFPQYFLENKKAANRIFFNENEVVNEPTQPLGDAGAIDISFRGVDFTYPNEPRATLKNVNLSIPAGSKVAVVGASGSGKSTLLQLILKLEEASDGEVYINSQTVSQMTPESLWQQTNTVMQDQQFFAGTIRDNLLSDASDEQLTYALKRARLTRFSLADEVYEKGDNLSGGEKQRLAIARLFLRDTNLWLLDEPTSSLDQVTAREVMTEIILDAENDTVVIVSHNLRGLSEMDQIIVMDHGEVVEQGTFDGLMAQKGYFYQLKEIEKDTL
ncbi:thiol reductant ABC exporter subunit CydC [Alkalibacillus haloalkaliphilus]|uniref:thiol reductant ABC exporter subunit CydC n=1 Tax=Alkalibacillus haloalkaliphilus TaxID=94136 RepID=UPI0029367168|nr:thiol reductant ABC exporter subunit CydC [Alkalibacillus haloalkaliphilus]MDV2582766.1 thiol reductant ABC exporter subunit CydC [Alkalibacillus haloalkaliphilus]